jgi:hypothetical protein
MKVRLATLLYLISFTVLSSCSSDSTGPGDPNPEVVVPIQIEAGIGSTFVYEFKQFDANGMLTDSMTSITTLTSKSATFSGRSNVHVFSLSGSPMWHYQVDAQDNMWEYRPAVSGVNSRPESWTKLPTIGSGRSELILYDTTTVSGQFTSRILQKRTYVGAGREPFVVDGVSFNASRINDTTSTTSTINGEVFQSTSYETVSIYIPKLAILAYQRSESPFNTGHIEMRLISMQLK